MRKRVMVIGLDCLEPALALDRFADDMPNLWRIAGGARGRLLSIRPPITCPAWMCAFTGRDPGQLGVYGFRNRAGWDYGPLRLTFSDGLPTENAPAVWDLAGQAQLHSIVIGVPPGYPPRRVRGEFIGCFLTPGPESPFAYPPELAEETAAVVGEYRFDVSNARDTNRQRTLDEIHEMTEKRWRLARHLLDTRAWDLFVMVEIGTDRMHHAFWQFSDPQHVLYAPNSPFAEAIRDYYRLIDRQIGTLIERADDDTLILCVSDHGAQRMDGGFFLNEWLMAKGYLALKGQPVRPGPLRSEQIDWGATIAWGDGGYYGRIFLNVAGREPLGTVTPERVPEVRSALAEALRAEALPWGQPGVANRVFIPSEIYRETKGFPPDLILYPGDLYWRALGSLPSHAGEFFTKENDTGPDGANHAPYGVFAAISGQDLHRGTGPARALSDLRLVDLAPTIAAHLNLRMPDDIVGRAIDPALWGE